MQRQTTTRILKNREQKEETTTKHNIQREKKRETRERERERDKDFLGNPFFFGWGRFFWQGC